MKAAGDLNGFQSVFSEDKLASVEPHQGREGLDPWWPLLPEAASASVGLSLQRQLGFTIWLLRGGRLDFFFFLTQLKTIHLRLCPEKQIKLFFFFWCVEFKEIYVPKLQHNTNVPSRRGT